MTQRPPELDAKSVVDILQRRLQEESWRAVLLEAQVVELQAQLADARDASMEAQQLRYRVEELERERSTDVPGE